jgi:hypothetical protein
MNVPSIDLLRGFNASRFGRASTRWMLQTVTVRPAATWFWKAPAFEAVGTDLHYFLANRTPLQLEPALVRQHRSR